MVIEGNRPLWKTLASSLAQKVSPAYFFRQFDL